MAIIVRVEGSVVLRAIAVTRRALATAIEHVGKAVIAKPTAAATVVVAVTAA